MSILLRYQGPSVDDGTMDVYDAASNMVAFSNYVVTAAHHLYGQDVTVRAEVNAFQHGSFVTDLMFQVVGLGATILTTTPDIGSVVTAVKESFQLFIFLKGRAPAKVEHRDNRSINVTNNDGDIIQVNVESLSITLDEKASKAARQFVGEALSRPGVHQIEITSDGKDVARATSNEARYFHPIEDETPVVEQIVQMGLMIETPSFKDGKKWAMWDGENSPLFAMEDESFLARIDNGEPFRKGDTLLCDVRVTQTKVNGSLRIQRAIIKVHDHIVSHEQRDLGLAE